MVSNQTSLLFAYVARGSVLDLFFGETLDELTEPSGGTWSVGDEPHLQLTYFPKDSPYEFVAEQRDGCNWSDSREDADRMIGSFLANEGDMELEESNSGWRIDFDVDLEEDEGENEEQDGGA